MTEAASTAVVDGCIQYLAPYVDVAGQLLDGASTQELNVRPGVPMLNVRSVVFYDDDIRAMIGNVQGETEVNSRQPLIKNADGSLRLVFSLQKAESVPEVNWI